jgi:low affinity Fe/Cu permease
VLNNAQSRDTSAINAKLDSVISAIENADNRLIGIEQQPESAAKAVIEEIREAVADAEAHGHAAGLERAASADR